MSNKERVVEEFIELAKIDSESRNEERIAEVIKAKLEKIGLEIFQDEAGNIIVGNSGNIIARLPGDKDRISLMFSAHMDTVKPGKNVQPFIENGIIKSKGNTILGADDKAGVSAIIEMLRVIKEKNLKHGPIQIIFTVGEEIGLRGAKALDPKLILADIAYVLDSSGSAGHIVIQGPSQKQIEATITGKAAHAGIAPEEGINAIQIAARGITKMKIGRIDDETTANIGIIKGGEATNIVPECVFIEGEARSFDNDKIEKQCKHMVDALQKAAKDLGGTIQINVESNYPRISLDKNSPVVLIAKEAACNLDYEVFLEKTGGGSDANIFNGYGIPTANLGCGMEKVHTTEEFITVENLQKNVSFLLEIVKVAYDFRND